MILSLQPTILAQSKFDDTRRHHLSLVIVKGQHALEVAAVPGLNPKPPKLSIGVCRHRRLLRTIVSIDLRHARKGLVEERFGIGGAQKGDEGFG